MRIIAGIIAAILLLGSVAALALDDHAQRLRTDAAQAVLAEPVAVELPAATWQYDGRYELRSLHLGEILFWARYGHGTRFLITDRVPVAYAPTAKEPRAISDGESTIVAGPALVSVPPNGAVLASTFLSGYPATVGSSDACAAIASGRGSLWIRDHCFFLPTPGNRP